MTREESLKWWKGLTDFNKSQHYNEFIKNNFTPAKDYTQLTGREIQIIINQYNKL